MEQAEPSFRLEVESFGDVLRAERLARSLREELAAISGVTINFAPTFDTPLLADYDAAKGIELTQALIMIIGSAGTAHIVVAAIKAWVERERNRIVRITSGEIVAEIPAKMTPQQQAALEQILTHAETLHKGASGQ